MSSLLRQPLSLVMMIFLFLVLALVHCRHIQDTVGINDKCHKGTWPLWPKMATHWQSSATPLGIPTCIGCSNTTAIQPTRFYMSLLIQTPSSRDVPQEKGLGPATNIVSVLPTDWPWTMPKWQWPHSHPRHSGGRGCVTTGPRGYRDSISYQLRLLYPFYQEPKSKSKSRLRMSTQKPATQKENQDRVSEAPEHMEESSPQEDTIANFPTINTPLLNSTN